MKILLLGEYSNVHATLADGLRTLGHEVTVASNGDFWKNYPRDIDLPRTYTKWGGIKYMARLLRILPQLKGYDVVQLINPMFLEIKAKRIFPIYSYLKRHNKKIILCGFGMDYYWVNTNITDRPLRYSDFNFGEKLRTDDNAKREIADWIGTEKERLNKYIADDCDAIVTGLYEYWVCYHPAFPEKTSFIPFPIKDIAEESAVGTSDLNRPIRIFIGINKTRSVYKGTDIMLKAAQDIKKNYADKVELNIAENVPFSQYVDMMSHSDLILDQLYSYTPAMNALAAMAKGIICVGGGEPENYDILHEEELRPIINVEPSYESVFCELEQVVLHPECIGKLKKQGIEYVRRHHDYRKVARQYLALYEKICNGR
ncbi:MAG: glycosyltransferase family 1 protein [Prevotella sp.]|nr:glycosyltransferase family 1 protein [Prevotella sp.]